MSFEDKIHKLWNLALVLDLIHWKGLVHRDFHAGNILNEVDDGFKGIVYITDFGLCRPANEKDKGNVYGVLPYIALELLFQEKPYTQASDIYSFGIIAWEILSGKPPYHNIPHDMDLTLRIHDGLRPEFQVRIPQSLEDLIKRCWNTDSENRPTANELVKISREWQIEIGNKSGSFTSNIKKRKNITKLYPKKLGFPNMKFILLTLTLVNL